MSSVHDETVLDDPAALAAADRGGLLRARAGAGAQVRIAARAAEEAGVRRLAGDSRPRAVVVTAAGSARPAADVLQAVLGGGAPVPVVAVPGPVLPGWVGAVDLVLAASASGSTSETLAVVDEAARRGARLLTVGPARSPLAERALWGSAVHVPADADDPAPLWALAVPLVLAADAVGLARVPPGSIAATADTLDGLAERCAPARDVFENPAKTLAAELLGTLPLVWGSGDAAVAAAVRFAASLRADAKLPVLAGALPDAAYGQVAALDGPLAAPLDDPDDFFRDRVDDPVGPRLRLVLLRDPGEHRLAAAQADALPSVAQARGVAVTILRAEGNSPLERVASLLGVTDLAGVYLALATGQDPGTASSIRELKERTAR